MTRITVLGPITDLPDGPEVWVSVESDRLLDLPSAISLVSSPEELALLSDCPLPAVGYTQTWGGTCRYDMTWALAYAGKQDA